METQNLLLIVTAASLGFLHTLLGPDHYIPFIAMSRAAKWSRAKTIRITIFSGIGHISGSVILGVIGFLAGTTLNRISYIESLRGELAAWFIISFGLIYLIWGIKKIYHNSHHTHNHDKTAWILFTIFVLGPCEPLIPLLIYPAVTDSIITLILVVLVFAVTTTSTMVLMVSLSLYGLNILPVNIFEKYSHAAAGFLILVCGISIKFLGL